jgi:hypothetical protein
MLKSVVMAAAWLEIVAGAVCLTVLDVACRLLFAVTPAGMARPLGRFAGVALIALGIACLPSRGAMPRRRTVQALLVYNIGAATLFAWVGVATTLRGMLLWPAVILHAVITAALFAGSFSHFQTSGLSNSGERSGKPSRAQQTFLETTDHFSSQQLSAGEGFQFERALGRRGISGDRHAKETYENQAHIERPFQEIM